MRSFKFFPLDKQVVSSANNTENRVFSIQDFQDQVMPSEEKIEEHVRVQKCCKVLFLSNRFKIS